MLAQETFKKIRVAILQKLENDLSPDLFYHSVYHTIDVEQQAERIAISENVGTPQEILLLKLACLYHDCGFLFTYNDHEAAGCGLAKEQLSAYGLTQGEIDTICGMIMATKIPQAPLSRLEEVICDADLDYLGRDDFSPISNNLFLELKAAGFVRLENDWNLIQVRFFKQHSYFTATTQKLRAQKKQEHLEEIEAMLLPE